MVREGSLRAEDSIGSVEWVVGVEAMGVHVCGWVGGCVHVGEDGWMCA